MKQLTLSFVLLASSSAFASSIDHCIMATHLEALETISEVRGLSGTQETAFYDKALDMISSNERTSRRIDNAIRELCTLVDGAATAVLRN